MTPPPEQTREQRIEAFMTQWRSVIDYDTGAFTAALRALADAAVAEERRAHAEWWRAHLTWGLEHAVECGIRSAEQCSCGLADARARAAGQRGEPTDA